jgi:hypothetical protein
MVWRGCSLLRQGLGFLRAPPPESVEVSIVTQILWAPGREWERQYQIWDILVDSESEAGG